MTNKKIQHRGSVETLALSGNGDKKIIAKIRKLVNHYQLGQPYERNVLLRVQLILEEYLAGLEAIKKR